VPLFMDICRAKNKPSEMDSKESAFRVHLTPAFLGRRLDQIGYAEIQDYAARKTAKLKPKSVNNHLTMLRRLLVVAKKRGLIAAVPEIEWLKVPRPDFDFLSFEEATRLLQAVDPGWRCMVLTAMKTGLRQGELIALQWQDLDLVAGLLRVRRSAVRGVVSTPKSGKGREVPLGDEVLAALKAERHLRGPLVFCTAEGRMFNKNECKHPLWRACKRAGLREIGWHCLRHTFASHLVMRGAAMKVVQELLGHATIEMTNRYSHLSPEVPRTAVKLLDGLGRISEQLPGRQLGDSA
jgi:integrase